MQWSDGRNAGFSSADPSRLFLPVISDPGYSYQGLNVESARRSPASFLHWLKRLIAVRRRYPAFARGTVDFLHPANTRVVSYLCRYQDQVMLVVNNLSRFAQYVELDLREFDGWVPLDVFGQQPFPRIGTLPYLATMGPHGFYWFQLQRP